MAVRGQIESPAASWHCHEKGPGMREVRSNDSIPSSRESKVKYPEASTEITTLALVSTCLHFLTLLSGLAVRHRIHRHDATSYLNSLNHRFSDISKTGHAQKEYLIWHKRTSYRAMSLNVFVAFAYLRSSVGIITVKGKGKGKGIGEDLPRTGHEGPGGGVEV
jgi:hypothetical protein